MDTDVEPLSEPAGGLSTPANVWEVTLDGVVLPEAVTAGRQPTDVTIASELPMGEHEVWMTRQTEAPRLGRVALLGVRAVGGGLLPPPVPRRRALEVVGTSVETGLRVGVSATDTSERQRDGCETVLASQNHSRAWPKLAGDLLGAEVINVSMEGAGLLTGYHAFAGAGAQLPDIYPRADVLVPTPLWDGQRSPVDVVLVVVGWTDATLLDPEDRVTAARLKVAYEDFLGQVRTAQPSARIYAVVRTGDSRGWHRRPMTALIRAAVAARRQASDRRVGVLNLPAWSSKDANCHDHPNWRQQEALARAAAAQLRLDMGW